jgi:hypothetical protein
MLNEYIQSAECVLIGLRKNSEVTVIGGLDNLCKLGSN